MVIVNKTLYKFLPEILILGKYLKFKFDETEVGCCTVCRGIKDTRVSACTKQNLGDVTACCADGSTKTRLTAVRACNKDTLIDFYE